jgi:phage terminase large subunit
VNDTFRSAIENLRRWKKSSVTMVRELFHAEPDKWQIKALEAFSSNDPDKQRIAMKANKGPGKTAVLAWIIWNFQLCFAEVGEHPQGAATGISEKNLDDNLWKELSKWQQRAPLLRDQFTWTKSRISNNDFPETWFFSKRTWSKSADSQQQADTLAGIHAKYILFVLDESGGIPSSIMATAEGGLSTVGTRGKIVQAGNPTHLTGPLYDACTRHASKWCVIEITGDPDDPDRSPRIDVKWAREQIEMYGRNNPWVLVNVFGQFPPASLNALLGPDEVKLAMNRVLKAEDFSFAQKRLGIDVARFGDDRTVLFPRQGLCAGDPVIMRGVRTTEIAARVMLAKRNWNQEVELIDDTGHWGHGVLDNLIAAGHTPIPVVFHAPAIDPRYANRRAEMWLEMADWIKRGGAIPFIPEMIEELTEPTYTFQKGKFLLEDKDLIKERIGRSPDLGDALALTFAVPDEPNNPDLPLGFEPALSMRQAINEYNPFAMLEN